eukprot:jgi/Mesen1/145/ME1130289C07569
MVAASPCALAVAPLAYAAAVSSCASKGILLKGGAQALDALAGCNSVAFDKTGTLTTGELVCKVIEPLDGHSRARAAPAPAAPTAVPSAAARPAAAGVGACCSPSCEMEALAIAAAMEQAATHPIARAVLEHSEGKHLPAVAVDGFHTLPGNGLAATVHTVQDRAAAVAGGGGGGRQEARLGSVDYVAAAAGSEAASQRIRAAALASEHGDDSVQAALSVDQKVPVPPTRPSRGAPLPALFVSWSIFSLCPLPACL